MRAIAAIARRKVSQVSGDDTVRSSPDTALPEEMPFFWFRLDTDSKDTRLTTEEGSCRLYSEGDRLGDLWFFKGKHLSPSLLLLLHGSAFGTNVRSLLVLSTISSGDSSTFEGDLMFIDKTADEYDIIAVAVL